eukprot:7089322-Alexandrium_andersonii.AAC.1
MWHFLAAALERTEAPDTEAEAEDAGAPQSRSALEIAMLKLLLVLLPAALGGALPRVASSVG